MSEKYIYDLLTANDLILFVASFFLLITIIAILLFRNGVLQWITKEIKNEKAQKQENNILEIKDALKYYFAEKIYKTISIDIQTGIVFVAKLDIILKSTERLSRAESETIKDLLCELAENLRKVPDSSEKKMVINFEHVKSMNSRFTMCILEFVKNVIEKNGLVLIIKTKKDSVKSITSLVQNIKKYQSQEKKNYDDWNIKFEEG